LERTVRDSGALADGRLQIAVDVARDVESIAVDDPNLRRTVLVLIDNARRAMPRGGELRIEARREGDDAVIHVVDTGVGMSPYFMQHHLFRPFVAEWDTGDGLGLSLVEAREAARRGGGDLEVASREGIGTRVSIFRPLASFDLGNEPHDVPFSRVG
jgi:NtrC-family two-component system sensor histidine kinase KinB